MQPGRYALWLIIVLCLSSTTTLFVAGFRYAPMQVDGGWASYGGFAVSQDREPYLHQGRFVENVGVPGVKSLFDFDTVSNTRALYTGLWLRAFAPGWRTLKALGVLEFLVLVVASSIFFWHLLPTRSLAVLATLLLATDKMIVSMAASTFRPDVSQAALSCLLYLALRVSRATLPSTIAVLGIAAVAGAFSATAVVPVAAACVLRGAELVVGRDSDRWQKLGQTTAAAFVAASVYLSRQSIFPWLLGSERTVIEPVDATARIADVWSGGPVLLLAKELGRWETYFVGWNFPLLLALLVGMAAWLVAFIRGTMSWERAWHLAPGVVGIGILLLLDPHPRPQHLAPLLPVLLLVLSGVAELGPTSRRLVVAGLAGLTVLSSAAGFGLSARRAQAAQAVGYSNAWLEATLGDLALADSTLVVAGGTEFWSFWDPEADVTIFDRARIPTQVDELEDALPYLDFAVLSADYRAAEWIPRIENRYGLELRILHDKRPYVVIADGFERRDPDWSPGESLP